VLAAPGVVAGGYNHNDRHQEAGDFNLGVGDFNLGAGDFSEVQCDQDQDFRKDREPDKKYP